MKRSHAAIGRALLALLFATVALPAAAAGLIASTGWKAEIDHAQPSPPRLVVTARLHVPTPGYRARLKLAAMMKSFPPIPIYDLVLTPPTKPVPQVLTWIAFRHVEPIAGPAYRGGVVRYRGRTIARLRVAGAGR